MSEPSTSDPSNRPVPRCGCGGDLRVLENTRSALFTSTTVFKHEPGECIANLAQAQEELRQRVATLEDDVRHLKYRSHP